MRHESIKHLVVFCFYLCVEIFVLASCYRVVTVDNEDGTQSMNIHFAGGVFSEEEAKHIQALLLSTDKDENLKGLGLLRDKTGLDFVAIALTTEKAIELAAPTIAKIVQKFDKSRGLETARESVKVRVTIEIVE